MKKIFISTLFLLCISTESFAAEYNHYQTTSGQKIEFSKPVQEKSNQQDTIFSNPQGNKLYSKEIDKTVIPKIVVTKNLKLKYKDITKNEKIIEACELLKNTAGSFSYYSIHGKNKTKLPIAISFVNFSNDPKHENVDAYGSFSGKGYKININSKFQDAPAAALSPVIAREALVSKEKDVDDADAAEQLQIAVWTQMLEMQPYLESSQNKLVVIQNKLKDSGNIAEYGVFLKEASNQDSKKLSTNGKTSTAKKSFTQGQAAQENFDIKKQEESERISSEILSYDSKTLEKKYKKVTKEDRIMEAMELLKDSVGKFSHDAILGKNITHKPISVKFRDLSEINPKYSSFDALGWRQAGKLSIYINSKHADAPAAALAAILSHEALHQDEYDSLNEETYAWTMEASVWTQLCEKYPDVAEIAHPLVTRENLLKKLLEKGDYSDKYIKKSVFSNPSYSNLPVRSPGFEDDF